MVCRSFRLGVFFFKLLRHAGPIPPCPGHMEGEAARRLASDGFLESKSLVPSVAEVNKALDRFTETTIDDKTRKHTLALELARLDELQETFYARALEGDVQCGALITKIIERRCTMLGLYTPQTATLQVIEAETPRETSTDKNSAHIERNRGKTKDDDPDDPPSTH